MTEGGGGGKQNRIWHFESDEARHKNKTKSPDLLKKCFTKWEVFIAKLTFAYLHELKA